MLKKYLFQIHWFCGITVGLILSLMGITGAILAYEDEIIRTLNQDSFVVEAQNSPKLTPSELYQRFHQSNPQEQINSITVSASATESSVINIAKEGAKHGENIMLNPYTAEVLPSVKGEDTFKTIELIHRGLIIGTTGRQITGFCVAMLLFFVLSGLYLRWPSKHSLKQWLWLNRKLKGRSFYWSLHAVMGTWVAVFYLLFAVTGLTWSYSWWKSGFYTVIGVEAPQKNKSSSVARLVQPSSEEISIMLAQAWDAYPQQIQRDYSTLTMSIPKDKQSVKITFFDAVVQHDRARNSATYQVASNSFDNISLYADKALNEKIAVSILPIHNGRFFGAVVHFLAMVAALLMPLFFITGWLLYLKRREQQRLVEQARADMGDLADIKNATPEDIWTIFFASQTGTAEQLAYDTAKQFHKEKVPCQLFPLSECQVEKLAELKNVLFIVSTYGSGDSPDTALGFVKHQLSRTIDLSSVNYAVLALGSKDYAETFCGFGVRLNQWLLQNQAKPIFEMIKVSNADVDRIMSWYESLAVATGKSIAFSLPQKNFSSWLLLAQQQLNPGSQGTGVYQVSLKPQQNQTWQAGDVIEVQCGNSEQRRHDFIQQHGLSQQAMDALLYKDLMHVSDEWDKNIDALPLLPLREYSIASLPEEGCVQLLIRQKINDGVLGLGSGWMTQYAKIGQQVLAHIRSNPSFHLVENNTPAIFIASGTGLAGVLSLLKQRLAKQQRQNWLLFGERQRQYDFLCQEQLEQWQQTQGLVMDCAFSRDQAERIYVQDLLLRQSDRLKQWIAQGAVIYVCGSLRGMAGGVDKALRQVLGDAQVEQLLLQQRYKRDVY